MIIFQQPTLQGMRNVEGITQPLNYSQKHHIPMVLISRRNYKNKTSQSKQLLYEVSVYWPTTRI